MTALGGLLFGFRFLQTDSLFVTSIEHALYGASCLRLESEARSTMPRRARPNDERIERKPVSPCDLLPPGTPIGRR